MDSNFWGVQLALGDADTSFSMYSVFTVLPHYPLREQTHTLPCALIKIVRYSPPLLALWPVLGLLFSQKHTNIFFEDGMSGKIEAFSDSVSCWLSLQELIG